MIKYITGDIFQAIKEKTHIDCIMLPHITNCMNSWGAGFVVPLAKHLPESKESYHNHCKLMTGGNIAKPKFVQSNALRLLGMVDYVSCPRQNHSLGHDIIVANMCAQTLGRMQRPLFYNKLVYCMDSVATYIENLGVFNDDHIEIMTVKFGSGLGGGNWSIIEELINDCWIKRNIEVTVCVPEIASK
jgi:hypothetical protein